MLQGGEEGGGVAAAHQEDLNSCPICLDELSERTITACGHHFCPPCIREVLAHGRNFCPICRSGIKEAGASAAAPVRRTAPLRSAGRSLPQ